MALSSLTMRTGAAESLEISGAGEGNRTLVISLGSWSNAIIRHPLRAADFVPDTRGDLKFFFAPDGFSTGETMHGPHDSRSRASLAPAEYV